MYENDKRIVLTLDAGGTNFVFSAVQGYQEMVTPLTVPPAPNDLDKCLTLMVSGFESIISKLPGAPAAISFAFPGPADYENGIIGDLPNFPSFRGGVALGPFLQRKFNIPVFINNDGNLFAYGEALRGTLPMVNKWLAERDNPKSYRNVLGITLGTGFGAGVVLNDVLLTGDNGCGGDVWIMKNKKYPNKIVEESVSVRAVKRVYQELSGEDAAGLTPKDIFEIAEGKLPGDKEAAVRSFEELGEMAGHAISYALTIVDGILVIGGGLSAAYKYIFPELLKELTKEVSMFSGERFSGIQMKIYNLMDDLDRENFLIKESAQVNIPNSTEYAAYGKVKKIGIVVSAAGTSKAVEYGAYAFALQELDRRSKR